MNLERFEESIDHNAQTTTVEVPLRKGTEEEEETDNRDNTGNPEQKLEAANTAADQQVLGTFKL